MILRNNSNTPTTYIKHLSWHSSSKVCAIDGNCSLSHHTNALHLNHIEGHTSTNLLQYSFVSSSPFLSDAIHI